MKSSILTFFLFCVMITQAQNKQILYGFDKIPQGALLNPGQENSYKAHIGFPLLSGVSLNANISGITVADLFRDDAIGGFSGTDFNTKLDKAINDLDDKDYFSINAQIEVISAGYRLNNQDYLSFGFYEELDVFVGLPKDLYVLANEGNAAHLNKVYSASEIAIKAEVLGVLYAGITRRFNNRITGGIRLKLYSGALNVNSSNNQGSLVTRQGADGIYTTTLSGVDAGVYSSGVYDEDNESDVTVGKVLGNSFLSKNIGVGIDVGFTYHINEQIELTGSLLDLGFVSYSKNVRNRLFNGGYSFSGFGTETIGGIDYIENLEDDFLEKVSDEENKESYSVLRPIKLNSSIRYSFGKSRYEANCHDIRMKDYYDNAVGAQLYAVSRPNGLRMAFTGFYERKFAKFLNTKITYTIDDFSASNIGLGISTNIWKVNVYGLVDNVFKLGDIADANTASLQFGINFIFN